MKKDLVDWYYKQIIRHLAPSQVWMLINKLRNLYGINSEVSQKEVELKTADGSVISGKLKSWKDYEDSDSIQVVIEGYGTYYTHISNVWLHNPD